MLIREICCHGATLAGLTLPATFPTLKPYENAQMKASRAAQYGLIVLTVLNILNYMDRYIVASLVESLKKSELALNDTQAGLLMTSFLIVYMVASPIFGELGDRKNRTRVLTIGVVIWSLATLSAHWATSFVGLFLLRALVGVGEAAYGTIAPTWLTDAFSTSRRNRAFAIFYCAIPVGAALGYVVGGYMDVHYGWRSAFLAAGIPGLIIAIFVSRIYEPPRPPSPVTATADWRGYLHLFQNRRYAMIVGGYAAYTFAIGALAFWLPAFLEREHGLNRSEVTVQFGMVIVITGLLGTLVGGIIADKLEKRGVHQSGLWVSGLSTLSAFPFFLYVLFSHGSYFWTAMIIGNVLAFLSTGPINLEIVRAAPPNWRARAIALSILAIHILGDVPSPPLVGYISDHSGSLRTGMMLIPVFILLAGTLWCLEGYFGRNENVPD
jgi:MFS family permease